MGGEWGSIRGWFPEVDQLVLGWLLPHQTTVGQHGDICEIGVYLGKTAIFLAAHLARGEKLTVCDLFELPAPDREIQEEKDDYAHYGDEVTLERFLANFRRFHDVDPVVVQSDSSLIGDVAAESGFRLVHVDASHLYSWVKGDITQAHRMLADDGVVVVDDFRARHSPGVGAAVWEQVLTNGLRPVMVTEQKFYGTWGDPSRLQECAIEWLAHRTDLRADVQQVIGHRLVRVVPLPSADALGGTLPPPPEGSVLTV